MKLNFMLIVMRQHEICIVEVFISVSHTQLQRSNKTAVKYIMKTDILESLWG